MAAPAAKADTTARPNRAAAWLLWTVAAGMGGALPTLIIIPFIQTSSAAYVPWAQFRFVIVTLGWGVAGTVSGTLTWLVLRRYLSCPFMWVVVTALAASVGGLAALAVGVITYRQPFEDAARSGVLLAWALVIALAQFLVLRTVVDRAALWIAGSLAGWVATQVATGGAAVGLALVGVRNGAAVLGAVLAVGALTAAMITGLVVVVLMGHVKQRSDQSPPALR